MVCSPPVCHFCPSALKEGGTERWWAGGAGSEAKLRGERRRCGRGAVFVLGVFLP